MIFVDNRYMEVFIKIVRWNILFCVLEIIIVYDFIGRIVYIEGCKKVGVVFVFYFLRYMNDFYFSMKYYGLGF